MPFKRLLRPVLRRLPFRAATHAHKRPIPDHMLLLLTNPRSGSTWFFDALRCHPALEMLPEAAIFEHFDLKGRRYPRDLATGSAGTVQVEVKTGVWESLPNFELPPEVAPPPVSPRYAVEKLHPHFFDHQTAAFVQQLRQIPDARMIYHVRNPQESIISFLRYQQRNPTWNPHLTPAQVPAHMHRIYETMLACARAYPGIVVDYAQLEQDFVGTLQQVFAFVWQDAYAAASPQDVAFTAAIAAATSREKRAQTTFLGARTTHLTEDKAQYAALFSEFAADIAACDAAYQALLSLPQSATQDRTR